MTVLYFSATGNSLFVARQLASQSAHQLVSIPQAVKQGKKLFEDDQIGLVFPVHWILVPPYIQSFLRQVRLNSRYIFAVMTYGKMEGAAVSHLVRIAGKSNISFSYINTIRMVDNYLPTFSMDDEIASEPGKHIEEHLKSIRADVNNGKRWIPGDTLTNKVLSRTLMLYHPYKNGVGFTKNFRIEAACNGCGTCVKVCPVDNIQLVNRRPQFGLNCVSCLACTHHCPQNAIRLKGEKSRTRFRNQHVSLKDIIEANQ
jgi:ferredoxin